MLFCSNISSAVAKRSPSTPIDWAKHMKDADIVGPEGVISKFKAGEISEDEFFESLCSKLAITGLVTKQEFIDAWNSTLQIKPEDLPRLRSEISQIPADEFLGADTNVTHQRYIASLFGPAYVEATDDKPAMLCGKILIRSYDLGVTSTVLHTRDSVFEEKATELYCRATGKAIKAPHAASPVVG